MTIAYTTNFNLGKPEVGARTDQWGTDWNTNADLIDAALQVFANLGDPVTVAHGGTGATTVGDARTALGLGTAAQQPDTRYAHRVQNLADLADPAAARTNIGANSATNLTTGELPAARLPSSGVSASSLTTGTLPEARLLSNIMRGSNNLSEVVNAGTARSNLELGSAATQLYGDVAVSTGTGVTNGNVWMRRIGGIATLSWKSFNFSTGSQANLIDSLPVEWRPAFDISNVYFINGSYLAQVTIKFSGAVLVNLFTHAGSAYTGTSAPGGSITWSVEP